jgi:nitronate monooxygenase/enoyl-[acyl-carrier protein] reductase II
MLRTALCDLLKIEYPIIQAGMGEFTSAELVAAVSNAGGLGSLGCAYRSIEEIRGELEATKQLTSRPFAVNHLMLTLDKEAFALTLAAKPSVISFAGGDPGDFVKRAHEAGILVLHQVHTVQQAYQAAERDVDIIIAQGSEAGGHGGTVAAMSLIPQVVDAVRPIPVVASGGIADGRGLAAALVMGAVGVNIGTRFLAAEEAPVNDAWKTMILEAASEQAVKFEAWNDIMPPFRSGGYKTSLRALRTPYIDHWQQHRNEAKQNSENLRGEILEAMRKGNLYTLVPGAGQSAGLVDEILPAREIVHRIAADAEQALEQAAGIVL